jgi:hypothetical protein
MNIMAEDWFRNDHANSEGWPHHGGWSLMVTSGFGEEKSRYWSHKELFGQQLCDDRV